MNCYQIKINLKQIKTQRFFINFTFNCLSREEEERPKGLIRPVYFNRTLVHRIPSAFFPSPSSPLPFFKGWKNERERGTFRIGRFNPPDDIYSRESYSRVYTHSRACSQRARIINVARGVRV